MKTTCFRAKWVGEDRRQGPKTVEHLTASVVTSPAPDRLRPGWEHTVLPWLSGWFVHSGSASPSGKTWRHMDHRWCSQPHTARLTHVKALK